ncbi:MAG: tRNA preQ1(34) S-adenosylmethionine ribosyltransferase-isomerase QueA [Chloroflexi bacterium]|nr:tRNA preQ1(34) S-adenosylmethionine ribosyltransferase-isomerase QueA [Chloroflexota bacterium]MBU1750251.1 tRNA preQ1(34) S-adenosylmethionine ribosyltransferase-isomerase QueA [Chloroflexota bacterium]MBU1880157.1 tRNA preQ1(34) S-adenosylmethionine ribosyltransferase-isomerase QueA [Chloroflexota bacterium]
MKTSDFDYDLLPEFIAQTPIEPRDAARLMVVHRDGDRDGDRDRDGGAGQIEHCRFYELGEYLRPGDVLVGNESRVIHARLFGHKVPTGGQVELLLLRPRDDVTWEALVRPGRRVREGTRLAFADAAGDHVEAQVIARTPASGGRVVRFDRPILPLLDALGVLPLPPYIHTPLADPARYQTVYAHTPGSVAAPTAGLHFTPDLLLALRRQDVQFETVTLHISLDTFRPIAEEDVSQHQMHTEWCELTANVARRLNQARLEGRRIVAVGTTAVRVLETAAQAACGREGACGWQTVAAFQGATDLFIMPGYRFRAVDALITNFHLPRSTLLLLVSAFAGHDLIRRSYQEAIRAGYRFYSLGDAQLLL